MNDEVFINEYCNGSIRVFKTLGEANICTDIIGSERVACHRFVRVEEPKYNIKNESTLKIGNITAVVWEQGENNE